MNRLPDPRKAGQVRYSQSHLIWLGILLFMTHAGSRRQLRHDRLSERFEQNLVKLSGQGDADAIADPDTLAYYAERCSLEKMERLTAGLVARLIRMKALDAFRLYGFFTIAVDGSQVCTFDSEPWPGCPHRTRADGTTQYFAYVLDAKLVTPSGMVMTVASEMLTNEGHRTFDKQDCELKAFPRLIEKIYSFFPRTPLCLLLDGLYANQNIIRLIQGKRWKYIITLKEGSMRERFAEACKLLEMQPSNRLKTQREATHQSFGWAKSLPIAEFSPDVLFCAETTPKGKRTDFVWITNFELSQGNAANIANKGGRLRWKIENEGFNVTKNNGYEMKHPCSRHPNGIRIFYLLMQIAHLISQLVLHGSLIRSLCNSFGSAKNFARRLAESLRHHFIPDHLEMPGQIRFQPP